MFCHLVAKSVIQILIVLSIGSLAAPKDIPYSTTADSKRCSTALVRLLLPTTVAGIFGLVVLNGHMSQERRQAATNLLESNPKLSTYKANSEKLEEDLDTIASVLVYDWLVKSPFPKRGSRLKPDALSIREVFLHYSNQDPVLKHAIAERNIPMNSDETFKAYFVDQSSRRYHGTFRHQADLEFLLRGSFQAIIRSNATNENQGIADVVKEFERTWKDSIPQNP